MTCDGKPDEPKIVEIAAGRRRRLWIGHAHNLDPRQPVPIKVVPSDPFS